MGIQVLSDGLGHFASLRLFWPLRATSAVLATLAALAIFGTFAVWATSAVWANFGHFCTNLGRIAAVWATLAVWASLLSWPLWATLCYYGPHFCCFGHFG